MYWWQMKSVSKRNGKITIFGRTIVFVLGG